jgi:hypothetical protein
MVSRLRVPRRLQLLTLAGVLILIAAAVALSAATRGDGTKKTLTSVTISPATLTLSPTMTSSNLAVVELWSDGSKVVYVAPTKLSSGTPCGCFGQIGSKETGGALTLDYNGVAMANPVYVSSATSFPVTASWKGFYPTASIVVYPK